MRQPLNRIVALLVLSLVAGCSPRQPEPSRVSPTLAGGALPAGYTGLLPCADCPGIRYTLDLRPDNVFFLRMTYLDGDEGERSIDDIGMWALSADGATLILRGGREAPTLFAIKGAGVLRKLDIEGKEIESKLNYDLLRMERFQPFEPRLFLRGIYSHTAGAGMFQECITDLKLPVVQEGDNAALEAAYLKARREPGEPLLVNLEGRFGRRRGIEAPGGQEVLMVERFMNVWPGEGCGRRFSTAQLENTYWKLIRLGDEPVIGSPDRREAHIRLNSNGRRVEGSATCNTLLGGYELEGQELRFTGLATTRMFCPGGMDQEQAFLKALAAVATWNIVGDHLDLYDAGGPLLARFGARPAKE